MKYRVGGREIYRAWVEVELREGSTSEAEGICGQ